MDVFSPVFLSSLLVLLPTLAYTIIIKLFRSRVEKVSDVPAKSSPPGSMGWLLLGETLEFLKPHFSGSPGIFLQQHCSRYGKVFKSHLFGSKTIVSCDLELNTFILQNEGRLFQASYPKAMHGILGKFSLLIVSGDLHRKLRSMNVSYITSSKSSPHFLHWVEKLSISMMDSWKGRNEVSFFKEAKTFTLSLTVKHLLNVNPEEALASRILEDFQTYMKGFISLPINLPRTAYAKALKARVRISSIVTEIMAKRRKRRNGEVEGEGEASFLDMILSKQNLNDEERVSVVLDILLGGYETTSTLMALIVYFLHHSPIALAKLKEEHKAIRENKKHKTAPLEWEDYKKMEYSHHVISEAVRCGNVVKFVHREALQDVKFKEMVIPCGWKVLPIFTAAHLDPDLHNNPANFDPSRWIGDGYKEMSRKVTAFGGGARLCPGAELAKVVVSFFLHHLVLRYRWKTKPDECPLAHPYVEFRRGLLIEIEPIAAEVYSIDLMGKMKVMKPVD